MDCLPLYTTVSHQEHDVSWRVVSPGQTGVLCVACLVELLEDCHAPLVQRRVVLSLLAGLLEGRGQVAIKFGDNVLLSRHVIDIITDHFFTNDQHTETAIEVCHQILECVQSEDLVWYTIDRFYHQLRTIGDLTLTSSYMMLVGRLVIVSPAYGLHLLEKHESLLLLILELLPETPDESCQCSVVFLLFHLFEDSLQAHIQDTVRHAVHAVLISMFNTAETTDLRVNLLALLKKILRRVDQFSVSMLMTPSHDNKSLVMGLKKMFISKQEVLHTASAQCVQGLLSQSTDGQVVGQILDSDLAEFLFESLHTHSTSQLDSVYQCLQALTSYDQFFNQCHAVYGVESILRSLSIVLDMKNYSLARTAFSLLAGILEKQPAKIPLFVNTSAVRQCAQLVQQGLSLSQSPVFMQAVSCCYALIRKRYLQWPASSGVVVEMLNTALTQMSDLLASLGPDGNRNSRLPEPVTRDHVLTSCAGLVSAVCSLCKESLWKSGPGNGDNVSLAAADEHLSSVLLAAVECCFLPFIISAFGKQDHQLSVMKTVFKCVCEIYAVAKETTRPMSLTLVECGVVLQLHQLKSSVDDTSFCETATVFLQHLYQFLLDRHTPDTPSMPGWLTSGIGNLTLPSISLDDFLASMSQSDELSWSTLVLLYFSYLYDVSCIEGSDLLYVVQEFLTHNGAVSSLPPLVLKSLVFLIACCGEKASSNSPYKRDVESLLDVLESCPLHVWYTHHPVIMCWVFDDDDIADKLGTNTLQHWLPLLHLTELSPTHPGRESGDLGREGSDMDTQLVEELQHSTAFLKHLMGMLVVQERIADFARLVTEHIINNLDESGSSKSTVDVILSTCSQLLHHLFLQAAPPHDHHVSNILSVVNRLIDWPDIDTCAAYKLKNVYHVVKYVGGEMDRDRGAVKVCLEYLQKYTKDDTVADCLSIGPILTQNRTFMQRLESCLTSSDQTEVDLACTLLAWVAQTSAVGSQVPYRVEISQFYVLGGVTLGSDNTRPGSLCLLSAALSGGHTDSPVVFSRDGPLQDTPLFTASEVRTIYFHLQQLVLQDCKDLFSHGLECMHKLYRYSNHVHPSLASHLIRQPWSSLWMETLLHVVCDWPYFHPHVLQVLHELSESTEGQDLLVSSGETLLHCILQTQLNRDQTYTVRQIIAKCQTKLEKTVESELLQKVDIYLKQANIGL